MDDTTLFQEVGKVLPYLSFGSRAVAESESTLRNLGITHIFSVVGPPKIRFPDIIYEFVVDIRDRDTQPILDEILDADEFITNARRDGGVVYVHCEAGISRSTTIVMGHLMLGMGMSFEEALELVQFDRPIAVPNPGFCAQLKLLEKMRDRTRDRIQEWTDEMGEEDNN